MRSKTNGKCPQGDCSGEGEYITHQPDSNGNELELYPATTCDCGRTFKSLRGLRIHKARWCQQRCSPNREYKSTDGTTNQDYTHSVQDSIVEHQPPGDIPSKPKIQWPKGNQKAVWSNLDEELSFLLSVHLKGPIEKQMGIFCKITYDVCYDRFGIVSGEGKNVEKKPNRRQMKKGKLRSEQRLLKRRLKESHLQEKEGILILLNEIKQEILKISRAENQRKKRKKRRQARKSFYTNPYGFAKKLFVESKSGQLDVSQKEIEDHLYKTYTDKSSNIPISFMENLPILKDPIFSFDIQHIKFGEVLDFVRKARAGSAPGVNGISYKLYKNCPRVLRKLTGLLQRTWKQGTVPQDWCLANGIWIPKEMNSKGIPNFRPISLLNIEGKIFFGVIAQRMTSFIMSNKYINTSVQKAGVPGFPGCLEHAEMIWGSIMSAKKTQSDLHVIWLDLANAYGSVPHELIDMALNYFHFPEKIRDIIMKYFRLAFMRFTMKKYTTRWQSLEIGIMMGCVISPLLFVLAMELILRSAANTTMGVTTNKQIILPPSRAFMDDITIIVPSKTAAKCLLDRYFDLLTTVKMRIKPKKSRSLSIIKGSVRQIHFNVGEDIVPTVKEIPVKSLGRLYEIPLTDRHRGMELQNMALKGLEAINKTFLPGKMKAWCYQYGLVPRLSWPMQIYEIALSRIEQIEQHANKYLRKWLGVPPCFSKIGLYTNSGSLQLPLSSLVEEFKVGKVRLQMMMNDSNDEFVREAHPAVKAGTKWSVTKTIEEAESSLRTKEIMGLVQVDRAGLGSTKYEPFSKMGIKDKRKMVTEEIKMFEEEKRKATAVTQAKQCAWTTWSDIEPVKLSWNTLIEMEPLAISYLLRSTYDLLPCASNLKQWGYIDSDLCTICQKERGTLRHVLSACSKSLPMFTWRHNQVLEVLVEIISSQCILANKQPVTTSEPRVQFCQEGKCPSKRKNKLNPNMKLLNGAKDWKVSADLKTSLKFPVHILQTEKRPDILLWSDSKKSIFLIELTVPWEENFSEAHERKKDRYECVRAECIEKGWMCNVMPIEVGCRGFLGHSTISLLSKIGVTGRDFKKQKCRLQTIVRQASCWIWRNSKIFAKRA